MKKNIIALVGLLCLHFMVYAQPKLMINLKENQQTGFFLNEIKNISFTPTNLVVNFEDNNPQNILINSINNFRVEVVSIVTDIEDNEIVNKQNSLGAVALFPNPASETVTVKYELQKNEKVEIEVFNLSGTSLLSIQDEGVSGQNSISLPLNQLNTSGIYLVKLKTNDKLETLKLIKY